MNQPCALPPSVNFHLWRFCNMRCSFCFATFRDVLDHLSREDALELVRQLTERFNKITFVGGEPTLCPWLLELIQCAHDGGTTTMLVTNGARLGPMLPDLAPCLDWIALSVDSSDADVRLKLGRATGGRAPLSNTKLRELALSIHQHGIRLKINSVVTSLTVDDDLTDFIADLRPERWKLFQVLPVKGQNDTMDPALLVTQEAFQRFVARHQRLEAQGTRVVDEGNDDMRGSYAMIDPLGRFFDNTTGGHRYSEPILHAGLNQAWSQISFDAERFERRGGLYEWSK